MGQIGHEVLGGTVRTRTGGTSESSTRARRGGGQHRPRRRWIALGAAVGLVGLPAIPAAAGDTATRPDVAGDRGDLEPVDAVATTEAVPRSTELKVFGTGDAPETYLIRLADSAVPAYTGGEPGLAPTAPAPGGRLDPDAAPVRAYRDFLVEEQVGFVERMERTTGHEVEVPFTYQYAVNGVAAVLTAEEARAIAEDPAVVSIAPDQVRELHTDVGPQWQNADALWN